MLGKRPLIKKETLSFEARGLSLGVTLLYHDMKKWVLTLKDLQAINGYAKIVLHK
jgi:hypothetical protein